MSFGSVISERRKELGLSQRDLAARIQKDDGEPISPQYLNDLERDRRNAPSNDLIREFSRELRLPPDYLEFVAGRLPDELLNVDADPADVQKAFVAFRKVLRG